MRADKSKFKEQRRPDSLSGTATGSLREWVNRPMSEQRLSLAEEPFLLQMRDPGAIFRVQVRMRKLAASRHVSSTRCSHARDYGWPEIHVFREL